MDEELGLDIAVHLGADHRLAVLVHVQRVLSSRGRPSHGSQPESPHRDVLGVAERENARQLRLLVGMIHSLFDDLELHRGMALQVGFEGLVRWLVHWIEGGRLHAQRARDLKDCEIEKQRLRRVRLVILHQQLAWCDQCRRVGPLARLLVIHELADADDEVASLAAALKALRVPIAVHL